MDVAVQVGSNVQQYAKLRMLEFYYDFMDRWAFIVSFDHYALPSVYITFCFFCIYHIFIMSKRIK